MRDSRFLLMCPKEPINACATQNVVPRRDRLDLTASGRFPFGEIALAGSPHTELAAPRQCAQAPSGSAAARDIGLLMSAAPRVGADGDRAIAACPTKQLVLRALRASEKRIALAAVGTVTLSSSRQLGESVSEHCYAVLQGPPLPGRDH